MNNRLLFACLMAYPVIGIEDLDGACVFDDANARVLNDYFFSNDEMTVEMCLSACSQRGYNYAGLEWQIECYCGDRPKHGFEWAWSDKCDDRCAGNANQICGGSLALSVYTTTRKNFDGLCIYDFPSPRQVLDGFSISGTTNMTIENCQNICTHENDFEYFGVQNGDECYCGDSSAKFLSAPPYQCNIQCSGNQYEICGGSWRLNVFQRNQTDIPTISSDPIHIADRSEWISLIAYKEDIETSENCGFHVIGETTIFDTGSPYENNLRCSTKRDFHCTESQTSIHFKFDRFETESNHDFLFIESRDGCQWKLDGEQQTDVWVKAEYFSSIDLSFYSDDSVRKSGVRMIMECRISNSSTPYVHEQYGDGCPTEFQNESISIIETTISPEDSTISPNEITIPSANDYDFISSEDDSNRDGLMCNQYYVIENRKFMNMKLSRTKNTWGKTHVGIYNTQKLNSNQVWKIICEDDGTFSFQNFAYPDQLLGSKDGSKVDTYGGGKYKYQLWFITKMANNKPGRHICNVQWRNRCLAKFGTHNHVEILGDKMGAWNIRPLYSYGSEIWIKADGFDNTLSNSTRHVELQNLVGYTITKTSDFKITTKAEVSGVAKALGLGASFEASIKLTQAESKTTTQKITASYTVPAGSKYWLCQRVIYLNTFDEPNAVQIFDDSVIANGPACDSG